MLTRFDKQATVMRFTATGTDRRGHASGTYQPAHVIGCDLQTLSGTERYSMSLGALQGQGDAETIVVVQHRAFAAADADVTEADRLLIDGITYHVAHVADPTGHGHHLEIDLYRIKSPTRA